MKVTELKALVAGCKGDPQDDVVVVLGGARHSLHNVQITHVDKDNEVVVKLSVVRDL